MRHYAEVEIELDWGKVELEGSYESCDPHELDTERYSFGSYSGSITVADGIAVVGGSKFEGGMKEMCAYQPYTTTGERELHVPVQHLEVSEGGYQVSIHTPAEGCEGRGFLFI